MLRAIVLSFAVLLSALAAAAAQERYALVIGNDDYVAVTSLQTARNDARAISSTLEDAGFRVSLLLDATRRETNRAVSAFRAAIRPGDTALVFYAGHGIEIDGENYLLPTDIVAPGNGDAGFVKSESIPLSRLLDDIRSTGARTLVAIIDACRDNPFPPESVRRGLGATRGLGRIAAPQGTFVIFSAGAGQAALDRLPGDDRNANSVFTRVLLARLAEPGLELRDLVSSVRSQVSALAAAQDHAQFPAYYDELMGDFYVRPAAASPDVPPPEMEADFLAARETATVDALTGFMARYDRWADHPTMTLARSMLATLRQQDPEPPVSQPPVAEPPVEEPPITEPPAPDPADIVRATQEELNRLGCAAGAADGAVGPRTRAALDRYRAERPGAGEIGSGSLLAALRAEPARVCPAIRVNPEGTSPPPPIANARPAFDIAGRWTIRTKCPGARQTVGLVQWSGSGSRYSGILRGPSGESGTASASVRGETVSGSDRWDRVSRNWTATLTSTGGNYSGSSSDGCRFTATRQ